MANANSTIAIMSSSKFKWTAEIQYKESLSTRDEAILYASQHHYNLIVKYERRPGPLFDVLLNPDPDCTSQVNCELVEAVAVEEEAESNGWSKLILRGVTGLVKRLGAAASTATREKAMPPVHSHALAAK